MKILDFPKVFSKSPRAHAIAAFSSHAASSILPAGSLINGSGQEYPELEDEVIHQALAYAAASVDEEIIELPRAV